MMIGIPDKRVSVLLALGLSAALLSAPAMATEEEEEAAQAQAPKNTNVNAGSNVSNFVNLRAQSKRTRPGRAPSTAPGPADQSMLAPGSLSGLSGGNGDGIRRINIWASGAYSDYEDDLSSTDMDGETWNATAGIDYLFLDWLIAGVSLGYEDSDSDTNYNQGHVDTDGITVSPYVLFLLNRYVSVDGAFGYSDLDIDQDRTLPGTATIVTGSLDAERFFGSAGVNVSFWRGNWNFSGRLGYFYTAQENDAFVESDGTVNPEFDTQLGQAQVNGRVAYYAGIAMPYVSVDFNYDTTHDISAVGAGQAAPSGDRSEFVIGGGVDFFITDMISAGVRADTVQGRANFDSVSASGNVSFRF